MNKLKHILIIWLGGVPKKQYKKLLNRSNRLENATKGHQRKINRLIQEVKNSPRKLFEKHLDETLKVHVVEKFIPHSEFKDFEETVGQKEAFIKPSIQQMKVELIEELFKNDRVEIINKFDTLHSHQHLRLKVRTYKALE